MNTDDPRSLVVDAHRNGDATSSPDAGEEAAGKAIEYADGDWHDADRDQGSRSFVGHEVVLYGAPTVESVEHEPPFLRRQAAALARALPDAELQVVPGAGTRLQSRRAGVRDRSAPGVPGPGRFPARDGLRRARWRVTDPAIRLSSQPTGLSSVAGPERRA